MSKNGAVEKVIVKFDNPKAGQNSRRNHPTYAKKYPEGTGITKVDREYTLSKSSTSVGGSTARLIQYPLILAFAVTVHKIQGQTIERAKKTTVDLKSVFEGAQAYVMLSRMKELDQLYILDELPQNKIYPIRKAQEEIERLDGISMNKNPNDWEKMFGTDTIKISYLNCRSLVNRFENIKTDDSLRLSDILVLAETWIQNTVEGDKFELEDYKGHLNSAGRGKGLAVFYKVVVDKVIDYNEENVNITKLEIAELDVIAVYRSVEGTLESLANKLSEIINPTKSTLVVGDVNVCNIKRPDNPLKRFLEGMGFKEVVKEATHLDGGHIDHAYVLNLGSFKEGTVAQLVSKYYSDHDAVCIILKLNL